jgi:hypothetical protein
MKISVIIPTNRPGGLEHAKACLPGQDFPDFEVLIGSPSDPSFGKWVIDDFEGGFWTLNRIYNRLLAEAKGELIVTLQDFIWIPPDGLARFWDIYGRTGGLVSGVGDQYDQVGLDGSHGKPCWADPRKEFSLWTSPIPVGTDSVGKDARQIFHPSLHEWNWAAMPKAAIMEAGGMDEEMDFLGFGCDNNGPTERMSEMGHPFYIDYGNEAICQHHGRIPGWDEHHTMWKLYDLRKQELKASGNWPILTASSRMPSRHRPQEPIP